MDFISSLSTVLIATLAIFLLTVLLAKVLYKPQRIDLGKVRRFALPESFFFFLIAFIGIMPFITFFLLTAYKLGVASIYALLLLLLIVLFIYIVFLYAKNIKGYRINHNN